MSTTNTTFAPLNTIISWFAEDAQPSEQQFETTWKSFFHKSENIPVEQIYQLAEILNLKAERDHMHFDLAKKDGSNLSVEDINGLKEVLGVALAAQGIINNISTDVTSEVAVALPDGIYKPKTTGVFTAIGLTAKDNYTTLFKKLDGIWSVFSEEKLPTLSPTGKVEKGNTEAVSGSEVYKTIFKETKVINFNDETKLLNGYLNASGIVNAIASAFVTDFIPISLGEVINTNVNSDTGTWGSAIYNGSKQFIEKAVFNKDYQVTKPDAKFIRIVFYSATNFNTPFKRMVLKNTDLREVSKYIPYNSANITESSDSLLNSKFYSYNNLLKNKNDNFSTNYYLGFIDRSNGNLTGSIFASSHFLEIKNNTIYVTNAYTSYGAIYDQDFNYISSISDEYFVNGNIIIKNKNAKYIRLTFNTAINTDSFYFGEGKVLPTDLTANYLVKDNVYQNTINSITAPLIASKAVFVGDSNVANYEGRTSYVTLLANNYLLNTYNRGIGGTRITAVGTNGNPTYDNSMVVRCSKLTDMYDIYILDGGINDANNSLPLGTMESRDYFTFYGALHSILIDWITRFKGKRIGVITPPNLYNDYRTAIIEVCNYYGVPYLDTTTNLYATKRIPAISTDFYYDGLHLTDLAHQIKSRIVYNWLSSL